MYNYDRLLKELKARNIHKTDLESILGISSRTIARIAKGEKLSNRTLRKIADYLHCQPDQLYRTIADNSVLKALRDEKSNHISGGIYHELQVRMTYNSNHIEGSQLSEEQTRMIFETQTVLSEQALPVDDILETVNHFRAIDYVIDHAEEKLTEEVIKHIHFILKQNTSDAQLEWFAVGDYKRRPNMVGGHATIEPARVKAEMKNLLQKYNNKKEITIEDIISFHAEFEWIHPFQDGNGRVGRLIMLKECLHHNIVPILIEDSKKLYYYRGLKEWNREHGWLMDTCLDGQDTFRDLLDALHIPYSNG